MEVNVLIYPHRVEIFSIDGSEDESRKSLLQNIRNRISGTTLQINAQALPPYAMWCVLQLYLLTKPPSASRRLFEVRQMIRPAKAGFTLSSVLQSYCSQNQALFQVIFVIGGLVFSWLLSLLSSVHKDHQGVNPYYIPSVLYRVIGIAFSLSLLYGQLQLTFQRGYLTITTLLHLQPRGK